jgi:hypothetical protein
MDPYISTLFEIVTKGRNTNSYKFALWRALATLAPNTNQERSVISKHDLSPLFLGYYWPLEVKYHVRQGIDPDKDPIVMKLIRQLVNPRTINQGESLSEFQKRMPEEYTSLLREIAQNAFEDVIPRFHIVHGVAIEPPIFTFTGREGKAGDTITLTTGGRQFLIEYRKLIDYVAVSGWVRFTEGFTSPPKLHDKIDGTKSKRGAVTQWRDFCQCKMENAFTTRATSWNFPRSIMYCRGHSFWRIGPGNWFSLVECAITKSEIGWQTRRL